MATRELWMSDEMIAAALELPPDRRGRASLIRALGAFGLGEKRARRLARFLRDLEGINGPQAGGLPQQERRILDGGNRMQLSGVTKCKDPDAFIAEVGVDLALWQVVRATIKEWTAPLRLRRSRGGDTNDVAVQQTQYLVSVELSRRVPLSVADAVAGIVDRVAAAAPRYNGARFKAPAGDHLLVLGLVDVHIGRLISGVGDDDARLVYEEAVEDLLGACRGRSVEQILIPLGNDFMNYDSLIRGVVPATTKGTPVESNADAAAVFSVAVDAARRGVELAASVAPVRCVWVRGNHDEMTGYYIASMISALFQNHPRVGVDLDTSEMKFHRYGTTLLGLCHGDMPRSRLLRLPLVMAQDRPQDIAETTCREWLLGHTHALSVTDDTGFRLRVLPSLVRNDRWHNRMGYRSVRCAEGLFYHRDRGLAGIEYAYPRRGEMFR